MGGIAAIFEEHDRLVEAAARCSDPLRLRSEVQRLCSWASALRTGSADPQVEEDLLELERYWRRFSRASALTAANRGTQLQPALSSLVSPEWSECFTPAPAAEVERRPLADEFEQASGLLEQAGLLRASHALREIASAS